MSHRPAVQWEGCCAHPPHSQPCLFSELTVSSESISSGSFYLGSGDPLSRLPGIPSLWQVPPRCFINIFQFIILEFLGSWWNCSCPSNRFSDSKAVNIASSFFFSASGASMLGSMLWSSRTGVHLRNALGLISHFSIFVLSFALFGFVLIFLKHGLLCSPCWLLDQRDLPTYASRVLGSKVYSTHVPQFPLECFRTHGGSSTFRSS